MPQKIIRTIYNCKYHLHPEMMPYTWELCTWDHPRVNLQELFSILVQNILPSPPHFVMIKPPETSSSRSMIHSQAHSFKETNSLRGAKLKHTTWKNQTPIRFFQKHPRSLLMDQQSCKDLFGKTMPVSNHLKAQPPNWLNSKCNWRAINVHTSNSWLSTNHKVLVKTQMESLVFPLTKIWARKSFTTYGPWKTTV